MKQEKTRRMNEDDEMIRGMPEYQSLSRTTDMITVGTAFMVMFLVALSLTRMLNASVIGSAMLAASIGIMLESLVLSSFFRKQTLWILGMFPFMAALMNIYRASFVYLFVFSVFAIIGIIHSFVYLVRAENVGRKHRGDALNTSR
jgi:hypothetical protein